MGKLRTNETDCLNEIKEGYIRHNKIEIIYDNADYFSMSSYLLTASANLDRNSFPDFICDGGIIEHFEVTTSKENRVGSSFKIKTKENDIKDEELIKNHDLEYLAKEYNSGQLEVKIIMNTYEDFSYQNFLHSLIRNMEKHSNSLMKSKYKDGKVIFLVEHQGAKLNIHENGKFNRFYKMSEDKYILSLIKDKFFRINFLIYKTHDTAEVIDLSRINEMLESAKENLDIHTGNIKEHKSKIYYDI